MDFEFDKEIDSLMRQMVKGEIVTKISSTHLDADEISAFAENALPKMARVHAMEHLADCTRCRKILADVISFNAEESSEIIHAKEEPKTIVSVPKIPWYSQLFAFPNLAYTMGALALIFSGLIGYVVWQSVSQDKNSSVAQFEKITERPQSAKGTSSDGETVPSVTYSNSNVSTNSASSVSSSSSNPANTYANSPLKYPLATPVDTTATNTAAPVLSQPLSVGEDKTKKEILKDAAKLDTPADEKVKTEESKPENKKDADVVTKSGNYSVEAEQNRGGSKQTELSQNAPAPIQSQTNNIMTPDTRNAQRNNSAAAGSVVREDEPKAKSAPKKSADDTRDRKETDSKNIGGKTFRSVSGVWTDTAYTGGNTKNVKRSSDDYKKLDSGLRSIADNLGGTVIIVWSGKAYKIQ